MEQYEAKDKKRLRCGYTTGSCAAAASKAAAWMLLSGERINSITIMTPKGTLLQLPLEDVTMGENSVSCAVRKDSGDDPDVTDGMLIYSIVRKIPDPGKIVVDGGEGIGRVTKKGLECPVGCAAINPVPRKMIEDGVRWALNKFNAGRNSFGISVEICAPLGAQISERTYNPRLGIVDGISILGTSGIVEPMSEQALIDTIKVEMKVLKAAGKNHIFLTPGNYGEEFAAQNLHLPLTCAVKTSNFIGDSLDLACELKFESVLLVGHMGKLIKLAGGIFNTHSKYADARMEIIAAHGAQWGAGEKTVRKIMECITTDEALSCFEDEAIKRKTIESIINKIDFNIKYRTKKQIKTGIVLFSKEHGLLGKTQNAYQQIAEILAQEEQE